MAAKKIALFIDADNISAKFGKQIIETLESRGEIFIRRIYGNWEKSCLHSWNECILIFSFRAVQQPDFVAGKNATDMSLVIDAMDVLYGGKADVFALVSNDSDFTPLAIRLRESGINVIGMGNENAPLAFRNACNEFINLDKAAAPEKPQVQPVQKVAPPPVKSSAAKVPSLSERKLQSERDKDERNKRLQQLHNIFREFAKNNATQNGFVNLKRAIDAITKKNLGFGVKNVGYTTWKKFIADFPELYEVQKTGNDVAYRCVTDNPEDINYKRQQVHAVLREVFKIQSNDKGFADLSYAGSALKNKNLTVKGLGHGNLTKFVSAFPDLYELKKHTYRCK